MAVITWDLALQHVEKTNPNLTACFIQGCAGDIKPMPADTNATTFSPYTIEQVQHIGEKLGQAVNSILQSPSLSTIDSPLQITNKIISLNMEPITPAQN